MKDKESSEILDKAEHAIEKHTSETNLSTVLFERKAVLKKAIRELLLEFEQETGLVITQIYLHRDVYEDAYAGTEYSSLLAVDVKAVL